MTYAPDGLRDIIEISEFPHSWGQHSIVCSLGLVRHDSILIVQLWQVVRINGSAPIDDGVIIIGAHQDRQVIFHIQPGTFHF